jgi:FdhE protein
VKTSGRAETSRAASDLERRAARADACARAAAASREPLGFAAGLYRAQARAAAALEAGHRDDPLTGSFPADAERVLAVAGSILRHAEEEGPEPLAEAARARRADSPETARTRLQVFWDGDISASEDYVSRAILRPYVEVLRVCGVPPDRRPVRGRCPFCGGGAWISVRRDGAEMEGAKRLLGCALCGGEWLFQRILCASCFEEDPHKLPSFQSEKHANVRIETCETCRRYVKSIDVSLDARPIPEVDDLLSLSMDLWAAEEGYTRIEPGLAGI